MNGKGAAHAAARHASLVGTISAYTQLMAIPNRELGKTTTCSPDAACVDQTLVKRCLGGDDAAWEIIVRAFARRIFNLCYRYTSRWEEAEDLDLDLDLDVDLDGLIRGKLSRHKIYQIALYFCMTTSRSKSKSRRRGVKEYRDRI